MKYQNQTYITLAERKKDWKEINISQWLTSEPGTKPGAWHIIFHLFLKVVYKVCVILFYR